MPARRFALGFNADVDPRELEKRLGAGRQEQQRLLELLVAGVDQHKLHRLLKPWLAQRKPRRRRSRPRYGRCCATERREAAAVRLSALHALYWEVLDSLNEIPVAPGQVIHNANPPRIVAASGRAASAEVHALGNPEGREILALEIRRPGPTFRAWDNVRFPLREIDVAGAIAALNLQRTVPDDFIVEPRSIAGRPGCKVSVDSEYFRLEHLAPAPGRAIDVPAEQPHSAACARRHGDRTLRRPAPCSASSSRGESALVPAGVGAYRVTADTADANLLKVSLPRCPLTPQPRAR